MKIHYAIVSIILVSLIFIGATTFMQDLGSNYNATADYSGINASEQVIKEQVNQSEAIYAKINSINLDPNPINLIDVPYKMITTGWESFKMLFTSWHSLGVIINQAAGIIGIPKWAIGAIVGLLTISLVVMLLFMFFKWKMED